LSSGSESLRELVSGGGEAIERQLVEGVEFPLEGGGHVSGGGAERFDQLLLGHLGTALDLGLACALFKLAL
jgi:hypothetical protein